MSALEQTSLFECIEVVDPLQYIELFVEERKAYWEGFVYGIPAGQPRPRSAVKKDRDGNYFVHVYEQRTLPKTVNFPFPRIHPCVLWKDAVRREIRVRRTIEEPVRIDIDFYMPRPEELLRKKYPNEPMWYSKKPDIDNMCKAVFDALIPEQGMKVLEDDCLIVDGRHRKFYCQKFGGRVGAYIRIAPAGTPRIDS